LEAKRPDHLAWTHEIASQRVGDRQARVCSAAEWGARRPALCRNCRVIDRRHTVKRPERIITSWNRGAQLLFGYTAQEAVGQPVTLLIPVDRHDEEPFILGRIRQGESVDHYETIRLTKDGRLIDISLTVSPIKNESGEIIGASKIARDISESKRAQERLKLLLREIASKTFSLLRSAF
jgi:PAS domain S-box-containing protein